MTTERDKNEVHRQRMMEVKKAQDAEVRSKDVRRGVVLVHTGDGKGKSTAAFGMAIRAAGHGQRVGLVQFIKGTWKTGEKKSFERFPEIDHVVSGDGFTWNTQDREKDIASVRRGWDVALGMIEESQGPDPKYDLIILDELNVAIGMGYLPVDGVVQAVANKPMELSICVTGRGAKDELLEVADTVSEMRLVKHAYQAGIKARRGVEF